MDCNDVKDALDAHIIGALNKEQSLKIETHIKTCQSCKEEFANTMQSLKKMDMLPMVIPSTSYADKIIHVQRRRKRMMIWMFIIILVVLIFMLWMVFSLFFYHDEYPKYHIANLEKGIWHYYAKYRKYPESLQKIEDEYFSPNLFRRDENNFILDTWGNHYRYCVPGKINSTFFDLYSIGPNKVDDKGFVDDIKNWK